MANPKAPATIAGAFLRLSTGACCARECARLPALRLERTNFAPDHLHSEVVDAPEIGRVHPLAGVEGYKAVAGHLQDSPEENVGVVPRVAP